MRSPTLSSHRTLGFSRAIRTIAASVILAHGLISAGAHAAEPSTAISARAGSLIVDAAQLEAAVARGSIIWDVRSADEYKRGHLPGAINFGDAGKVLRDEQREDFLPTAVIEKLFLEAGLDPAQEIVVYGSRGNPYAYFGSFALRYFGAKKVAVFHDGFEGWRDGGKAVSTEASKRPAISLKLKVEPSLALTTDEVTKRVAKPGIQIVDARTRKEFSGEDIRAIRGGHIPGAINIPFEENWQDPAAAQKIARKEVSTTDGLALKGRPALEALYQGLDRHKETIVYCQSGVRAAETSTVLESLGFTNVKVYDSSWLGWAARLSAPVDDEAFLNVGALTGQINSLKKQVDDLSKQLAAR